MTEKSSLSEADTQKPIATGGKGTRRQFLKMLVGGAAAATGLAGCENETDQVDSAPQPTEANEPLSASPVQPTEGVESVSPTVVQPTEVKEPPPPSMPELQIQNESFIVDGKKVVLRGAVGNHFVYKTPLENFKKDVDWMQQNDATFMVIQWNAGFLQEPNYIENLVTACEYAKERGLRVELTLHSRGLKPGSDWDPQQIERVDGQVTNDWDTLLADADVAYRLGASVDIFSPLSEPNFSPNGQPVSWAEWKPIAEESIQHIRQRIGKENAVAAVSGINYGSDAWGALQDPISLPSVGLEVHPYQFFEESQGTRYEDFVRTTKEQGILTFAGEMGHTDDPAFIERQYNFFLENDVSYAVYAINSSSDFPQILVGVGGTVTESGSNAADSFSRGKEEDADDE